MNFRTNEQILRNYLSIAEKMPKNVPVIFSAVLPVDEKAHKERWQGLNQRIQALNADFKSFISKSKNLFFVDAGHLLVDVQGNLAHEYHVGDGLYFNAKGNAIWIKELQKAIMSAQQSAVLNEDSSRLNSHQ